MLNSFGQMAGIYVHIPFCRQACHYCDFHFSTSTKSKNEVVEAIVQEIHLRADFFLEGTEINSIYLGGGTPSLLEAEELDRIFQALYGQFRVSDAAEITLEANPDDLYGGSDARKRLEYLRTSPVNRLSVGIQSFREEDLSWMNRAHDGLQAKGVLEAIHAAGFQSFSLDLIYGIPGLSSEAWAENLDRALDSGADHLSCYALTVEPRTALAHQVRKGSSQAPDDFLTRQHFEILSAKAEAAGFEHYEISNLALPGCRARHNSAYWTGKPYLGIGPSAHSFDGRNRSWNVANNARYLKAISASEVPTEVEELSRQDQFNEKLMTGLRTAWGVNLEDLRAISASAVDQMLQEAKEWEAELEQQGSNLMIKKSGWFMADRIASDLFWVD
jgi:oxygen-independent coproporphyrinogen-3 oxidase